MPLLRAWIDAHGRDAVPHLSVNLSRADIYRSDLCSYLKGLVERYDVPPSLLNLEITESAYMESPDQLVGAVMELRRAGFTVEMDDFGSGYSSLNTLKDVPVDVLKLDMGFLDAHERVVAEAVEALRQAERGSMSFCSSFSISGLLRLSFVLACYPRLRLVRGDDLPLCRG